MRKDPEGTFTTTGVAGLHRCRLAIAGLALGLAGCAGIQPPQPWEKGYLARPAMSMTGDPLERRFADHVYTSKENASGGTAVGGGGCGCN
ncbi:MAG: DUF4266 domain-containing protein [Ideonella sp.]|nr:DUF4266 domain-containing protein [Ideonella sp.]